MRDEHDMTAGADNLADSFGLSGQELIALNTKSMSFFADMEVKSALAELSSASSATTDRICQSLMSKGFSGGFSTAGKYMLGGFIKEHSEQIQNRYETSMEPPEFKWPILLEQILSHPPVHRDIAHWWLLMSSLSAATRFQNRVCGTCSTEPTMTGSLLECMSAKGEEWSEGLKSFFSRAGSELNFHSIDLQILGGEQATGGDFGLILDFDGKTVLPTEKDDQDPHSRIVPIIMQAKRYNRPNARVSQHNSNNGYQKDLLASNPCASAYIFYEDGTESIAHPLPPLVKRVEDVFGYGQTNTLEDSLDLPSYLLRCATDKDYASSAIGPEDALRMIFSKAQVGQLRELVVVSGDPTAERRYSSALSILEPEINNSKEGPVQSVGFD